mmetsp:Transcript_64885/g.159744  ORF Transcript_64885/g.159744 Transcript_64885/m.159744 type:complete len:242 (-) Transcript_64885:262-987(-)
MSGLHRRMRGPSASLIFLLISCTRNHMGGAICDTLMMLSLRSRPTVDVETEDSERSSAVSSTNPTASSRSLLVHSMRWISLQSTRLWEVTSIWPPSSGAACRHVSHPSGPPSRFLRVLLRARYLTGSVSVKRCSTVLFISLCDPVASFPVSPHEVPWCRKRGCSTTLSLATVRNIEVGRWRNTSPRASHGTSRPARCEFFVRMTHRTAGMRHPLQIASHERSHLTLLDSPHTPRYLSSFWR